jgi:5-deoxy-5-amino-3-dehydroquinate synthase
VVAGYDLPTSIPPGLDPDELTTLMHRDKKALHGLTFALDGPAGVEMVTGVPLDEVRAALKEVT